MKPVQCLTAFDGPVLVTVFWKEFTCIESHGLLKGTCIVRAESRSRGDFEVVGIHREPAARIQQDVVSLKTQPIGCC